MPTVLEFDTNAEYPVINLMEEQKDVKRRYNAFRCMEMCCKGFD
jgi:CTP synthase (UTP-ammonia lyase)